METMLENLVVISFYIKQIFIRSIYCDHQVIWHCDISVIITSRSTATSEQNNKTKLSFMFSVLLGSCSPYGNFHEELRQLTTNR